MQVLGDLTGSMNAATRSEGKISVLSHVAVPESAPAAAAANMLLNDDVPEQESEVWPFESVSRLRRRERSR